MTPQEAHAQAADVFAEARVRARDIRQQARSEVEATVQTRLDEYRVRASEILEQANADSQLLLDNARSQAETIESGAVQRAMNRAEAAKHEHAEALTIAMAKLNAAKRSIDEKRDGSSGEAGRIRNAALKQCNQLRDKATTEASALLAPIEALRAAEEKRMADALAIATERGVAQARSEIAAELDKIDERTATLQAQADEINAASAKAVKAIKSAAKKAADEDFDRANRLAGSITSGSVSGAELSADTVRMVKQLVADAREFLPGT